MNQKEILFLVHGCVKMFSKLIKSLMKSVKKNGDKGNLTIIGMWLNDGENLTV